MRILEIIAQPHMIIHLAAHCTCRLFIRWQHVSSSISDCDREVIEQKQGNHIVRIRSDSETNLDDLFKAAMQPTQSVPMRLRNLPPSFFQQPDRGSKSASHSRESSTDNTYPSPPPQPAVQGNNNANSTNSEQNNSNNNPVGSPPPHPGGLPINHPRAHSSPASLQQTYNSNAGQHQHLRQQSYDITDNIPLPAGWEMARTQTGQRYFLNHLTQTTTWEDPRKKLSTGSLSNSSGITCSSASTSPASSHLNLGPLPSGWEQATTTEGEIYFINHKNRTTSWYDPRIPMQLQQPPVVPILGNEAIGQSQNILSLSGQLSQTTGASATLQQQQQQLRLQRLQRERERLRIRQQEILRETSHFGNPALNEMMLRRTIREDSSLPTSPVNTEATQSTNPSLDPFLGANSDFHSRQESGDSGLGLSTNYSLPNTPEDYLMGMEEGAEGNDDHGLDQFFPGVLPLNSSELEENSVSQKDSIFELDSDLSSSKYEF
ncbi:transcriptional coactivator YAP1 [Caerostris darwini]|uniref:Transcriptional coactivator YAP1 n=1 Tax=Caerostris darwini TaxID=1538125 RepID=A0AAV4SLI8_9ARAC|nr:transcriptional coactivator YAP1 [Caerostris darwini]